MHKAWIIGPMIGAASVLFVQHSLSEWGGSYYVTDIALYFRENGASFISARRAVSDRLFDPYSAKFNEMQYVSTSNAQIVCGSVNSKNRMGAYIGMQSFAYDTVRRFAVFRSDDKEMPQYKYLVDICESKAGSLSPEEALILERLKKK
ncbi:hypothetical protein [Azorhizobium sp. AG788]|uniref:hypothetical protein n=1 Tax=Azorhizobium sp. AG788 TaxID=2183897 RepID=UPI00313A1F64